MYLEKRLLNKYGYVKDEKGRTVYRELNAGEEDMSAIKKENPQYFPKADPRDKLGVAKAQPLVDAGGNLTSIINNKGQRVNTADGSVLGAQPRRESTAPNNTVSGIYQRQEDDYYAGNEALRNRVKAIESQTPKGMTYAEYVASGGKVTTPKGGVVSNPRQNANALINTNTAGMGESQLAHLMRSINKAKEQLAMQIKSEGTAANLNNNNSASLAIGGSGQDTSIESLVDEVTKERNLAGADAQRNLLKKQLGLNRDAQEYQKERIIEERNRQEQDLREKQARAKRDAVNLYFGGAGAPTNTTVAGIGESRAAQYDDLIQNVQNARADDLRQLDFDIRQGNLEAEALLMDFNMQERTAIVNEVQKRIAESQGIAQVRREAALGQLDMLQQSGALTEVDDATLMSLAETGGVSYGTMLALRSVEQQKEAVSKSRSFAELASMVQTGEATPEEYEQFLKIDKLQTEGMKLRKELEGGSDLSDTAQKFNEFIQIVAENPELAPIASRFYGVEDPQSQLTAKLQEFNAWASMPDGQNKSALGRFLGFEDDATTQALNKLSLKEKEIEITKKTAELYGDNMQGWISQTGTGQITGYGSSKWGDGLDIDGNNGDPLAAPIGGIVTFAGNNGGFGNQVKIQTPDGEEFWFSHLQDIGVSPGQQVLPGQVFGTLGNTGSVMTKDRQTGEWRDVTPEERQMGKGSHLDLTVKKADGTFYTPQEIATKPLGAGNEQSFAEMTDIAQIGRAVYGARISDAEREFVTEMVQKAKKEGLDRFGIINRIAGFNPQREQGLATTLRDTLLQASGEDGLAEFDMVGLSNFINNGQDVAAVSKVEREVMNRAQQREGNGFVSEAFTVNNVEKAKQVQDLLASLPESPVGVATGRIQEWLGKLKGEDAAKVRAAIVDAVAVMRNDLLGSAVTPSEEAFLEPLIPTLSDSPANFAAKLDRLRQGSLTRLNSVRKSWGLPELDEPALLNKELRVPIYKQAALQPDIDLLQSIMTSQTSNLPFDITGLAESIYSQ